MREAHGREPTEAGVGSGAARVSVVVPTYLEADNVPVLVRRLQTVAGAGHMLPLTHGEAVNSAIADHLGRNRLAGPQPVAA